MANGMQVLIAYVLTKYRCCNYGGRSAKILKSHCTLDLRRHFFSERVANRWKSLLGKLLTRQP